MGSLILSQRCGDEVDQRPERVAALEAAPERGDEGAILGEAPGPGAGTQGVERSAGELAHEAADGGVGEIHGRHGGTLARFRVVPMQPEHYVEAIGDGFPWLDAEQAAWTFLQCGPAFTGFVEGRLAVVAGVAMESPGVGNAWAILTDVGRAHPAFVHRAVVRGLRNIIEDYRMTRVTARCVRTFYAARRWIRALGFTKEGTQRRAAPGGADFTVYRLFPEGHDDRH